MKEIVIDTLSDALKLFPFLFFAFLIMEIIEHKFTEKNKKTLEKSGKYGPIIGSIIGAFPQCGFSVLATNLFSARVITLGTLISIYLSTSDEMLPILLSEKVEISLILKIIGLKIIIGMFFGLLIDFIFRKKENQKEKIHALCEEEHCGCHKNLFLSSLKHTFHIFLFLLLFTFLLNTLIFFIGEDNISKLLLKNSFIEPFLTSLVGLIPNCASSVIITKLYLAEAISFGAMLSGLLTGSGVAIMLLLKENKDLKENLMIIATIYFIGALIGLFINIISFLI